jgi:ABC-2 type transport system permease protein
MKWHRVYGIILRQLYLFIHSWEKLTDAFYWPAIDLLLWGLTSAHLRRYTPESANIILIIISGVLFWLITWRGQYEISVNLLEDVWNKNLINIFVAPLKFSEWISSFIITGIVKAVVSLLFASFLAYLLYAVNIFVYGFYLIPFGILLIMVGWWVGFFVAGLILRYGTRVQTLAWSMVAVISPFSAIYYPLSVLPVWAQKVALFIPTSYIFEGSREVLFQHKIDPSKLYISFILNCLYLTLSIIYLKKSFAKVLEKGLIKVY